MVRRVVPRVVPGVVRRLLVPSAALLWGLQFALLNPALALLLVALYDADAAQVGLVLALHNGAGFLASLLVPGDAERRGDYLQPMLVCGALTIALAVVLTVSTTLPVAVVALIGLGGPAGVGNSPLFAHLRHSGASTTDVIHTRAFASFAWIAGPPLATLVMATFGNRAVLPLLGAVAVLTTLLPPSWSGIGEPGRKNARRTAIGLTPEGRAPSDAAHGRHWDRHRLRPPAGHERRGRLDHEPVHHLRPGSGRARSSRSPRTWPPTRRLRRPRAGDPLLRHLHQGREPRPTRSPRPGERVVPVRVRGVERTPTTGPTTTEDEPTGADTTRPSSTSPVAVSTSCSRCCETARPTGQARPLSRPASSPQRDEGHPRPRGAGNVTWSVRRERVRRGKAPAQRARGPSRPAPVVGVVGGSLSSMKKQ